LLPRNQRLLAAGLLPQCLNAAKGTEKRATAQLLRREILT
jgi:hypothetical protein